MSAQRGQAAPAPRARFTAAMDLNEFQGEVRMPCLALTALAQS